MRAKPRVRSLAPSSRMASHVGAAYTLPPPVPPTGVRAAHCLLAGGLGVFLLGTFFRAHSGYDPLLDTWLYDGLMLLGAGIVAARGLLVQTGTGPG